MKRRLISAAATRGSRLGVKREKKKDRVGKKNKVTRNRRGAVKESRLRKITRQVSCRCSKANLDQAPVGPEKSSIYRLIILNRRLRAPSLMMTSIEY